MEPTVLYANGSATWKRSVGDRSSDDGYTLTYECAGEEYSFSFSHASAAGTEYTMTLTPATTVDWVPGTYRWQAVATKSGERWVIASGIFEVKADLAPDVASGDPHDARSHVKKTLDALEALIEGRAADGVEGLSIRGRSLNRMAITELLGWRDRYRVYYQQEIDAAALADGQNSSRTIRVRFGL